MPSKWCPNCGRITSCNSTPNFCCWGCGSLKDEPLLPPYSEWKNGQDEIIEQARQNWEKRQKELLKTKNKEQVQMKLF